MMDIHTPYIHRCLELAARARTRTGINPMVGALLVREGTVIAQAWHEEFGGQHAEALLIKKCVQNIQQKDVLYLNLEPCCHTQKKTPPCTQAIIKSGVKHVVIGMVDPNPEVAGKGIRELRKYGISVICGIKRARCEWFNRGFVSLMTKGRPWVTLKRAETQAGAIACDDGSKMKITSVEQDAWSHQYLRAKHDAILVGVGTVVTDDPSLMVRVTNDQESMTRQQPLRIVLDPHLRIPLNANVVSREMAGGTMVVVKEPKETKEPKEAKELQEKMRILRENDVRIVPIPLDVSGRFDMHALFRFLTTPTKDFHGITSILVEGGAKTWETFRKANAVDCEVTLSGKE